MQNKKWIVGLLCVLCVLVVSCKHTQEIQEPEPIDLGPSMQVLFDSRPDNSKLEIVQDVQTLDDVILNSAAYLKAWELWENYSDSLEAYIRKIGETVSKSD